MAEDTYILEIPIKREKWAKSFYWGYTHKAPQPLIAMRDSFLHPEEEEVYQQFASKLKQESFIQGRYIAKKVISKFFSLTDPCSFKVMPGIFHQPVVYLPAHDPPAISISHSFGQAHCIVYPREHPMGIDVETISPDNAEHIKSQTTASERKLITSTEPKSLAFTRLWTIKESLSKVLNTGLFTPMELYEVEQIQNNEGYTESHFTYFHQYKSISFTIKDSIISLSIPKNSHFDIKYIFENMLNKLNH